VGEWVETTMSVSVLNVPSLGRWSAPINRMLRRSLPSHGGIATSGRALPVGVPSGSGESVGRAEASWLGWRVSPGDGDGVVSRSQVLLSSPMKMQPLSSTSLASRS